jgi:transposase
MNEKNKAEINYRRLLFKFFDNNFSTRQILERIPRSRTWLSKWRKRFQENGSRSFDSLHKSPKQPRRKFTCHDRALIVQVRKRLQSQKIGLRAAKAVRQELSQSRLMKTLPSISTINRWLKAAGLIEAQTQSAKPAFYPSPHLPPQLRLHSMDWMARYIKGQAKLFIFHTVEFLSHAIHQSIFTNKRTHSVIEHALETWSRLGLPDFLQLDNDSAFNAVGKKWGFASRFMRLALYFGIELIFIPPAEPKRNSLVESVNHLWSAAVFNRTQFSSQEEVFETRPQFLQWYQNYQPPVLGGISVRKAKSKIRHRQKLTAKQIKAVPKDLPLTEGRVHFIRRVSPAGKISILGEEHKVSKSLRGQYVWATLEINHERLQIYHRRSERAKARLVKELRYPIREQVHRLKPEFDPQEKRPDVLQII